VGLFYFYWPVAVGHSFHSLPSVLSLHCLQSAARLRLHRTEQGKCLQPRTTDLTQGQVEKLGHLFNKEEAKSWRWKMFVSCLWVCWWNIPQILPAFCPREGVGGR
jgi:hypothetical protein